MLKILIQGEFLQKIIDNFNNNRFELLHYIKLVLHYYDKL